MPIKYVDNDLYNVLQRNVINVIIKLKMTSCPVLF